MTAESPETLTAYNALHQNMLDVVLGMAQKTISNYVNQLTRTPVDKQYENYA